MSNCITRRTWMAGAGSLAGTLALPKRMFSAPAPAAAVAVAGRYPLATEDAIFDNVVALRRTLPAV